MVQFNRGSPTKAVLLDRDGTLIRDKVYLNDVATIHDGASTASQYSWLGTGMAAAQRGISQQGEFPSVTLAISKKTGENVGGALRRPAFLY